MRKVFKIKSINYHTKVIVTKKEQIIIWITALLLFLCFFLSIVFIESIWLAVLIDFLAFIIVFSIWLFIIFRSSHKNERIENTIISKQ